MRPIAEQMFPMVQGENVFAFGEVDGFMIKSPPAGQTEEEKGQHWDDRAVLVPQVELIQSWTAPKVWPVS